MNDLAIFTIAYITQTLLVSGLYLWFIYVRELYWKRRIYEINYRKAEHYKKVAGATGLDPARLADELQKQADEYWERGENNRHSRPHDFTTSMVLVGAANAIRKALAPPEDAEEPDAGT